MSDAGASFARYQALHRRAEVCLEWESALWSTAALGLSGALAFLLVGEWRRAFAMMLVTLAFNGARAVAALRFRRHMDAMCEELLRLRRSRVHPCR
jgi:hypothetical protein